MHQVYYSQVWYSQLNYNVFLRRLRIKYIIQEFVIIHKTFMRYIVQEYVIVVYYSRFCASCALLTCISFQSTIHKTSHHVRHDRNTHCSQTYIHMHIDIHTHTYICICICIYIHSYTCTNTYIHIHICTYIHKYICMVHRTSHQVRHKHCLIIAFLLLLHQR